MPLHKNFYDFGKKIFTIFWVTPSNLSQLSSSSYKIQNNYKAYHLTYATLLQKPNCLSRSPVEKIAILGSSINLQCSLCTPGRLMHVKQMQQILKPMTVQASFLDFEPTNVISLEACKSLYIEYRKTTGHIIIFLGY